MTAARNDRNTVQFGPSRTPQSYQLDRLEEQVKDLERTTTEQIVNITGNAELLVGTVVTYTSVTTSGTVDIDGTVVPFLNASSVRLEVDDVIILSANAAYPDPFAVGLVDRTGGPAGYDVYEFVNPNSVAGLPRSLAFIFGKSTGTLNYSSHLNQQDATVDAVLTTHFDNDTVQIENFTAGTSTTIAVPGGVSFGASVVASDTVTAFVSTAGSILYVYYGGVVTAYNYDKVQLAGVNSGVIVATASSNPSAVSGNYVISISATGVVTATDTIALWSGLWGTSDRFSRAGGGHVVVKSGSQLYVDGVIHTPPSGTDLDLPTTVMSSNWSANLGLSDIVGDNLYWLTGSSRNQNRTGSGTDIGFSSPATIPTGFSKMNLTSPGSSTNYANIMSVSGSPGDGEPMFLCSLAARSDGRVVIGGSVWTGYVTPGIAGNNNSGNNRQAAYWATNGVTTQSYVPTYALLDPLDQSQALNNSATTVSSSRDGSVFVAVHRRDFRTAAIIDGGTV